jgi:hypothetical protein
VSSLQKAAHSERRGEGAKLVEEGVHRRFGERAVNLLRELDAQKHVGQKTLELRRRRFGVAGSKAREKANPRRH